MIKKLVYLFVFLFSLSACGEKEKNISEKQTPPIISNNGTTISFHNLESTAFFKTEKIKPTNIEAKLDAPGKIAATVLLSSEGASQPIVLFDNPELAGNYTQLLQHQINISQIKHINIKQKQLEVNRTQNLLAHGAATGQDLLNVQTALTVEQTNLANEKTALIEHETKLKSAGFNPEVLRKARAGFAFIICDIPENQISKISEGQSCNIAFTAFPTKNFTGKIDAIADMVDNATRMIKVRIYINNVSNELKSGMFATVSFDLSEGKCMSINNTSIVTVQGKNYVFVKQTATVFERQEIKTGQQIGNKILVLEGLNNGDEIAVEGVMQLKGLSFGY